MLDYGQWAYSLCTYHDNDQVTQIPWMCKDAQVSDDGRTWTMTMRDGVRWYNPNSTDPKTGVLHTIDHVSYAWQDLNLRPKEGRQRPLAGQVPRDLQTLVPRAGLPRRGHR